MNIERMLILADHLKTVPHTEAWPLTSGPALSGFNMAHYICGTSACIAGWACELFGPIERYVSDIYGWASFKLDLDEKAAKDLFLNDNSFVSKGKDLASIEPMEAVDAILRMARQEVARLIWIEDVSPFGGLHIVIEDLNIDDESIQMCLDSGGLSPAERGVALYLLRLDEAGRQSLLVEAGQAQWGDFDG
ncbi:hypothetical protein [Candidatus Macondimonas diazotrophica]|jgi:hypothetical protein|uniref:Uncharacterized protein n=1 Tax=Candidatus Macondimonas diazotrophica TaxID=2305248 RepID=A0A4Z0F4S1_9GAMM|nr:hypothetical protein [Candidatus Macondimonas diazotrophica]TFZ81281.1 hypothetical protein E4680_13165 [Candidatus Macondimonas diazotrophica]